MLNLTPNHEDNRRALYSFPEAKVLEVKEDCILGRHYHKKKTEVFILHVGNCLLQTVNNATGESIKQQMQIGKMYHIPPNTYHAFFIDKDSVLIGLNSHPFTGDDDFTI